MAVHDSPTCESGEAATLAKPRQSYSTCAFWGMTVSEPHGTDAECIAVLLAEVNERPRAGAPHNLANPCNHPDAVDPTFAKIRRSAYVQLALGGKSAGLLQSMHLRESAG